MSRDYAKKNIGKRKKADTAVPKPSLKMWALAIVLIAVFVTSLFYLHKFNQKTAAHKAIAPLAKNHEAKKSDVKFEFYSSLPKDGQPAPEQAEATSTETEKPLAPAVDLTHKQQPPKAISHQYILQVASFRKYQDADDTKAKLLLAGFSADVQDAKVKDTTWYRVYIGPFSDLNSVKSAQQKLQQQHIQSLIVKQK